MCFLMILDNVCEQVLQSTKGTHRVSENQRCRKGGKHIQGEETARNNQIEGQNSKMEINRIIQSVNETKR